MPAASRIFPGPPPEQSLASPDGTFSVGVREAQPYAERRRAVAGLVRAGLGSVR
jgi:hypothetical protein